MAAKPTLQPATYSVEEVAQLLGVSRATAYMLARQNELPGALRVGHRIVVSRAAIDHLLAPKTEQTT